MNQEFLHTTTNQEALEKNLIAALTRLQDTLFETELLNAKAKLEEELPPEPFFGFTIGSYSFVVSASCFCEVFVDTPIASLPNASDYLVGLSNIRGVLVPVYQLHSPLQCKLPKKNTIFCIGKGESVVGILIDGLPVSLSLSMQQRLASASCSAAFLTPFIHASYLSNGIDWHLLDGNKFAGQLQAVANQTQKFSSRMKNNLEAARSPGY